jgi:NAD(P)-dependent dehydrogenase (short-subunit alcohol dehydrogenase family)
MELSGISAVVTGGASGLGGAAATLLAACGAKVTIFDLNAELGEAHAGEIGGQFVPVDVAGEASVAEGLARAEAAHGVPRVLVNCAGVALAMRTVGRDAVPHALDRFRRVVEVNLIGTFNTVSQFAARLSREAVVDGERGVIVNTASIAAFDGQVGQAAYAASKAGVAGLTLPVARDLAQHAIRIVTIAPGLFLTPMLAGLPEDVQASLASQVPFPSRLGRPAEFAALVRDVVGNPMLNGETIRLDGALRMAPR